MPVYVNDDEQQVCFAIEVRVPFALAPAFAAAMTGHDDDVILAAETAMRHRVEGALGANDSIELASDEHPIKRELLADRIACGCGATSAQECCAAVEGYFTSLGQRSDEELHSLAEGDGCQAARVLLAERRALTAEDG
ncbi:MAG: hypothetical protein LC798_11975 [Chloroflexi bacterium]|nr:hypothetical protein [Chloroflexota bacterium]